MGIQPKYLSAKDLAVYLSVSRTMVDRLVESGRLPQPIYLTPSLPRWDRDAVDAAMGKTLKSADRTLEEIDAWFERDGQTAAQRRVS